MERDFIKESGYRALDNRLKRISDRMSHDTRKFFKQIELDVEPSWHLIFKLLKEHDSLSVVEIADQLGYSHPSMVVLLKKMMGKGYVISEQDPMDKRKQNIRLTQRSWELLPELQQVWTSCEKAIFNMLNKDLSILQYLDQIENALKQVPFNERFYNEYKETLKIDNTR